MLSLLQQLLPFTVLKQKFIKFQILLSPCIVATALTVYGIETSRLLVLKVSKQLLQQLLPFTVLKLIVEPMNQPTKNQVATALTVYGIETHQFYQQANQNRHRCNSTYRLRY